MTTITLTKFLLIFVFLCIFAKFSYGFVVGNKNNGDLPNPVLVISVDGLRWDFIHQLRRLRDSKDEDDKGKFQSVLLEMTKNGAFAKNGIQSIFPTINRANQYSMVTGLFAENHGVVSNIIYDAVLNQMANLDSELSDVKIRWVYGGEPIWKLLKKQIPNTKFICYNWAGCDNGSHPYQGSHSVTSELKQGFQLILISMPFDQLIQKLGSVDEALKYLDAEITNLFKQMKAENLDDFVNVILLSGHGMMDLIDKSAILPENDPEWSRYFIVRSKSPTMWLVEPYSGYEDQTKSYFKQFAHIKIFAKQDIPDEWHYKSNPRVSPIIALAEPGYILSNGADTSGYYGYDNKIRDMRGTFIASGPAFIEHSVVPDSMRTIDVYPLLCDLLGITPAPNNGSTKDFASFVQPKYLDRFPRAIVNASFPNATLNERISNATNVNVPTSNPKSSISYTAPTCQCDPQSVYYLAYISMVKWIVMAIWILVALKIIVAALKAIIILSIILVIGIAVGLFLCYRSGECSREQRQQATATSLRSQTAESMVSKEKSPMMHKYDSEIILDLGPSEKA